MQAVSGSQAQQLPARKRGNAHLWTGVEQSSSRDASSAGGMHHDTCAAAGMSQVLAQVVQAGLQIFNAPGETGPGGCSMPVPTQLSSCSMQGSCASMHGSQQQPATGLTCTQVFE